MLAFQMHSPHGISTLAFCKSFPPRISMLDFHTGFPHSAQNFPHGAQFIPLSTIFVMRLTRARQIE